uniref:Sphingosine kinase 1 n=1 Tax=Nothobranchius furzeri TaxID=105023 RepID=A0A8C6LWH8_NOTFU
HIASRILHPSRVSELWRSFRMAQRGAEPEVRNGAALVTFYGEFTLINNRKVRCSVNLTEEDLIVQRLTSAPVGRTKVVLSLKDCVGCRAYPGDDKANRCAYFAAYFYPLRRRWMSPGKSRQRVEQCFRLSAHQDPRADLEEAEKWARAVLERSARQQAPRDGECCWQRGGKLQRSSGSKLILILFIQAFRCINGKVPTSVPMY